MQIDISIGKGKNITYINTTNKNTTSTRSNREGSGDERLRQKQGPKRGEKKPRTRSKIIAPWSVIWCKLIVKYSNEKRVWIMQKCNINVIVAWNIWFVFGCFFFNISIVYANTTIMWGSSHKWRGNSPSKKIYIYIERGQLLSCSCMVKKKNSGV